jgi:hypothetical protein
VIEVDTSAIVDATALAADVELLLRGCHPR